MDERLSKLEHLWLHDPVANKNMGLLWHLALRRSAMAMTELARQLGSGGSMADAFSPRGLSRRACRQGHGMAAYNLAMDYFNDRDLQNYRHWLRRAAMLRPRCRQTTSPLRNAPAAWYCARHPERPTGSRQ